MQFILAQIFKVKCYQYQLFIYQRTSRFIGNEGDIEAFAQNTGFMWDIAEEFHAMVVSFLNDLQINKSFLIIGVPEII